MPFHDIQGHRRIIDLLSRSVQRGTLPPSLIFAGSSASGARPTAIAVAQAFNCLEPRTRNSEPVLDACGVCPACVRIARGVHPDVPIVEPAETGLIRLDPVRDVIDRAAYRPFEGRRRVVIIDDADALLPQAQNALLKTLAEPTSYCDLHPTRGMLTKITAALGGETPSPSPARVDETGTPTPTATSGASAPTGAVVSEAPEMTPSPPVKKKRGFWSRVFGLGKDSEDGKPEAETKAPKKKPGG
ncbi:MAG: hypothetical protein DMG04_19155 [Acidobacteria bacterium]|nr:MAG: hypothetical protein DMG04_19155 [Acidobacteriota bacterium]